MAWPLCQNPKIILSNPRKLLACVPVTAASDPYLVIGSRRCKRVGAERGRANRVFRAADRDAKLPLHFAELLDMVAVPRAL
jgi:hypothetical protein